MYEAMTIVHCSGLQYTPGLTMVHQTTPMYVGSVSAGLVPGTVCEDWLEMVGGHQETAPLLHLPGRRLQHSLYS